MRLSRSHPSPHFPPSNRPSTSSFPPPLRAIDLFNQLPSTPRPSSPITASFTFSHPLPASPPHDQSHRRFDFDTSSPSTSAPMSTFQSPPPTLRAFDLFNALPSTPKQPSVSDRKSLTRLFDLFKALPSTPTAQPSTPKRQAIDLFNALPNSPSPPPTPIPNAASLSIRPPPPTSSIIDLTDDAMPISPSPPSHIRKRGFFLNFLKLS
jgi:hypothetical protein